MGPQNTVRRMKRESPWATLTGRYAEAAGRGGECSISFDADVIRGRLRELAFLNSRSTILFRAVTGQDDIQQEPEWETLHFGGGLSEYVSWLNRDRQLLHNPITASRMVPALLTLTGQLCLSRSATLEILKPEKLREVARNCFAASIS